MGGIGSSRWREHRARPVAEELLTLQLDGALRQLFKHAQHSASGVKATSVRWSQEDHQIGQGLIVFDCKTASAPVMRVSYRVESELHTETVCFDLVHQPLGGQRAYWRCPSCQRRCGVLYFLANLWRCRLCQNVTYITSKRSDRRINRLLVSRKLASTLRQLEHGQSLPEMERLHKTMVLIQRRADRKLRQWKRRQRHRS